MCTACGLSRAAFVQPVDLLLPALAGADRAAHTRTQIVRFPDDEQLSLALLWCESYCTRLELLMSACLSTKAHGFCEYSLSATWECAAGAFTLNRADDYSARCSATSVAANASLAQQTHAEALCPAGASFVRSGVRSQIVVAK
jgi:hypothetical protein